MSVITPPIFTDTNAVFDSTDLNQLLHGGEHARPVKLFVRAGPHPSTNRALRHLTSEVGRGPAHSARYGWKCVGRASYEKKLYHHSVLSESDKIGLLVKLF